MRYLSFLIETIFTKEKSYLNKTFSIVNRQCSMDKIENSLLVLGKSITENKFKLISNYLNKITKSIKWYKDREKTESFV